MGDNVTSVPADTGTGAHSAVRRPIPTGLVAIVAIGLAAAALAKFDLSGQAFVAAFFCAVLTVLAAIDVETGLIPNRIVLPSAAIVLAGNVIAEPDRAEEWLIAAVAAGLVGFAVALATRGGVGFGDAKLCILLGAGLGYAVLGGLVVGTLAGGLAAILLLLRHGMGARGMSLPYGPFLALGGAVALFFS